MCMDPYTETVFLFGGWDGNQDLSDLWAFHVPTRKWTLVTKDTEAEVSSIFYCMKKDTSTEHNNLHLLRNLFSLFQRQKCGCTYNTKARRRKV